MLTRQKISKSNLFILFVLVLTLLFNYFLGTEQIVQAHKSNFTASLCSVCQTCPEGMVACTEWTGFDFNYLLVSILCIALLVGISNGMQRTTFIHNVVQVVLSTAGFVVITELLVRYMEIPVLYTHFMDGTKSLFYKFLLTTDAGNTELNVLVLFASLLFGIVGNLLSALIINVHCYHSIRKSP